MSDSTKSVIQELLERPFKKRSFAEKRLIVENGRPCPKLTGLKTVHKDRVKEYTRNFKESQYILYPWLTGCDKQMKLFCWPCLLFSRVNSAWNTKGVGNLNTLQTSQKKHKQSISHLKCVLKLTAFSKKRIDEALSTEIRMLNSQHNLQVKKNREVLKRFIDVTCFLAKQELPFRGHEEDTSSLNRDHYVELLNLLKLYDPVLAEHFLTATVFKGTTVTIQNDLIKSVGEVLNSHICKQLQLSEFIAIMLDECSDTQMKSQLSVVFRYYLKGKIYETFVGFIDVSSGRSADDLFTLVKALLLQYDINQKLVAQTYDGAAVMSSQLNGLQTKVRSICPNALFVHCYAHVLNLVLSQGLNNVRECKIFFSTLNGIATFTSHSSKRAYALKEYLKRKIPSLATTRWCFSSRLINVVHTYRDSILQYFDSIKENEDSVWDSKDRMASAGYSNYLKKLETVFLLNTFSKLFAHSDVLFNALQNKNMDIVFCIDQIKKITSFLEVQKENGFSEVWQSTLQSNNILAHVKRRKGRIDQSPLNYESKYKKIFYEIIDNLLLQLSERFSSFEKLKYFDLLNGKNFTEYMQKDKFPESILKSLIELYPDTFEHSQLKNELMVLYASSKNIRCDIASKSTTNEAFITPLDVLLYIEKNSIASSFEQVYKLSKLICTIPATTASVERSFSALKRIKTYLRSTQGQERLNSFSVLSIEKAMLEDLQNRNDFYDQVIEKFVSVDRQNEFIFK